MAVHPQTAGEIDETQTTNRDPVRRADELAPEKQVAVLSEQHRQAAINGDTKVLDAVLADDWVVAGPTGEVETKRQQEKKIEASLRQYENGTRDTSLNIQKGGRKMAEFFAPSNSFRIAVRNAFIRITNLPVLNRLLGGFLAPATESIVRRPMSSPAASEHRK